MSIRTVLAGALLASCMSLGVGCRQAGLPPGDAAGAAGEAGMPQSPAPEAEPAAAAPDAVAEPRAPKPAVSAVTSPGKPLPPIDFDYRILGTPVPGQPLEIEISSRVEAALADLNVALSGNERLLVPIEMARLRLAAAAAGERRTRTIRVTPVAAGTVYLDVLLEAEIDGRLQSRAVTIPIRVGADGAGEAAAGTVSTDAEGEPIISLPAGQAR